MVEAKGSSTPFFGFQLALIAGHLLPAPYSTRLAQNIVISVLNAPPYHLTFLSLLAVQMSTAQVCYTAARWALPGGIPTLYESHPSLGALNGNFLQTDDPVPVFE